jgi:hypothetical protein
MAEVTKVLAQLAPATGGVEYNLYTAPTSVVVSSFTVCNRSSVSSAFTMLIATGGTTSANQHYLYYQTPIGGNDTFAATLGLCLGSGDVMRVNSLTGAANLSYGLFGVEVY